jgi:hypothetical protein
MSQSKRSAAARCPSPEKIRQLTAEIRAGWSPSHLALAAGEPYPPPKYRIPEVRAVVREPR